MTILETLLLLYAAHGLADYPLQGEFMSQAKNRHSKMEELMPGHWPFVLSSHAAIHGAFVGLITGVWWLGVAEFVVHWITDFAKCEKWIGIKTDQAIHILSKILWVVILYLLGSPI